MSLGAYSVVRYSNDLNDQRVNLGVIVWHPLDGFVVRISPSLDRAKAVDARLRLTAVKQQLQLIEEQIRNSAAVDGKETLSQLAVTFREGLQVAPPYPARITGVNESAERLYSTLIAPVPEFRRASTQKRFANGVSKALESAVKTVDSKATFKSVGWQQLNGVKVNVGFETKVKKDQLLWHPVSLQSKHHAEDQLAVAKAISLDISTIRKHLNEYKRTTQIVTLQPPKEKASEALPDVKNWLKMEADEVIEIPQLEAASHILAQRLKASK